MIEYYKILQNSLPFKDFTTEEILQVRDTLNLSVSSYKKGSVIFNQGDTIKHAGVLLKGSIIAESVSYSGERRLIQTHTAGSLFADVLMSSNQPTPVSVIAKEDCEIIFIKFDKLTSNACNPLCLKVLTNMLHGIAHKFWHLNRKIAYLSCKSLRSRVAMFLLDMQKQYGSLTFDLPYNREELASLLGVNRSALSRELSRMHSENIISFYKSTFKIEDISTLKNCL